MSHHVTDLSVEQLQAIELITSGEKLSDIAKTMGISRRTLWRWRQLPEFQQAIAETKSALYEEMQGRVAEIMRLSLVALERDLKAAETSRYNPLSTAFEVIKLAQPQQFLKLQENKSDN